MTRKIAIIGNPNVGKTVIFNKLTGMKQHVGNWPGVTVEKKEGRFKHKGKTFHITDLPGTYSLAPHAVDELIARKYILEEKPEIVIDVVDASNLERNLYLTHLLKELGVNVVVALNMLDVAENKGYSIDAGRLSETIGFPVVPMIATKDYGFKELKDALVGSKPTKTTAYMQYSPKVENLINHLSKEISADKKLSGYPRRWLAIKLLERDPEVLKCVEKSIRRQHIEKHLENAEKITGEDPEIYFTDKRYDHIMGMLPRFMKKSERKDVNHTERLDNLLLNKHFAIPIFLFLMWSLFQFAFTASVPFMGLMEYSFEWLGSAVSPMVEDPWLNSLLVDGLIGGMGFIAVFIPPIMLMFFGLSVMEDSGYLARAAFVTDKFMYKLGLHGRSFIPLLMGFGCNVPAIMAARSIESNRDRLITILINPFMSCSARLPVYALFAGVFFPGMEGLVIFSLYFLGIIAAIFTALLLQKTILKGTATPFILELPVYQIPTLRSTLIHMWDRSAVFVKKASTVLLVGAVFVWFISVHPWGAPVEESYASSIGKAVEPVTKPLGFDWRANVALLTGFMAKEAVVETFGILYGVEDGVAGRISANMDWLTAYAFMVFVLLYTPCIAVIGVMRSETGSWKWPFLSIIYSILLAYSTALLITFIGRSIL